eukprot:13932605-Alexandrium_andersonii.AAC.1
MSASLVGSEMCIRDRASRPPSDSACKAARTTSQARASGAVPEAACGLWAVSYTHLTLPTICSV